MNSYDISLTMLCLFRNIGFGLNGLNSLNQHHRHLNNSHHPNHIRNNHFRRPPRSHLRRRFRKEIRRLFVFFKYAAPMLVGILLGVFLFVIILKASHTKPQGLFSYIIHFVRARLLLRFSPPDNFLLSHSCNGTTQVNSVCLVCIYYSTLYLESFIF